MLCLHELFWPHLRVMMFMQFCRTDSDWQHASNNSPGLGHVTSEKQAPSAIDFVGTMRSAVDLEKRMMVKSNASKALKDLLGKVVAEYNRMVTVKKHRIDGPKRALCYNMPLIWIMWQNHWGSFNDLTSCHGIRLRAPSELHDLIHKHYDDFRHEASGNWSKPWTPNIRTSYNAS